MEHTDTLNGLLSFKKTIKCSSYDSLKSIIHSFRNIISNKDVSQFFF